MHCRSLILLLLGALPLGITAQVKDTVITLPDARIVADIPERIQGLRETVIEGGLLAADATSSLGEKLVERSPALIRANGPGSSATLSFRGTGAAHTRITWNGIPIQSATLGQSDISLVPGISSDKVRIMHGGAGTTGDAGSIGANIALETSPTPYPGVWMSWEGKSNSIGGYTSSLLTTMNKPKTNASIRINHLNDANHFRFHDNSLPGPDYPLKHRSNAAYTMSNAIADMFWYPKSNHVIHAGAWVQKARREIPSSLLVPDLPDNESQDDQAIRGFLRWDMYQGRGHLTLNTGISSEQMSYMNQVAGIDAIYRIDGYFHSSSYSHTIGRHELRAGESMEIYRAISEAYTENETRLSWKVYVLAFGPLAPRLSYFALFREEWMNGSILSPSPSLGITWKAPTSFNLAIKGNINRNQRVPSMNDLYWEPGGNPDLLPEDGWQSELGLDIRLTLGKYQFSSEITGYAGRVNNWIQWLPHPEMNYWTPRNLRSVSSEGIEFSTDLQTGSAIGAHELHFHYALTSTINRQGLIENDESVGKQLIYVPLHSGRGRYTIITRGFNISVGAGYTGKRYTTSANTRFLPAHLLFDCGISKIWILRKWELEAGLEAFNLLNTDYQVIAWYPMPLRYFSFGVQLKNLDK